MADEFKSNRIVIYYTDSSTIDEGLARAVRKQIKKAVGPIPIISVSQKPLNFGQNICVGEKPLTYQSMYEQLLAGLEAAPEGSIVYMCEHDVFYHPSHFAKLPEKKDHCYFNSNRYYWRLGMPYFFKARGKKTMSHGVAYREYMIEHCKERIAQWNAGSEKANRINIRWYEWKSERPNVDIRHGKNLTPDGHWKNEYFRGNREGIKNLPGWGGPQHFQSTTGYRESAPQPKYAGDAEGYLHKKYSRWIPQISPTRIPGLKRSGMARLFNEMGFKTGAEVGVAEGKYSEILCKTIDKLKLYCVDPYIPYDKYKQKWPMESYVVAEQRLKEFDVTFLKQKSLEAVVSVPEESLDFVYIDGDHRFDYVMEDIIAWARRVRTGGIISGHDYYRWKNGGVIAAVEAYTNAHFITEWFITDERKPSFFWVKK
jgi:hypothetical protein